MGVQMFELEVQFLEVEITTSRDYHLFESDY